ncbi:MAG: MFS transporter [Pseudomonadota bacterium]
MLEPQSIAARCVLALIPTVGLLYAYVSPLIISALEQSSMFTSQSAAVVFAANMYGAAAGSLLAIGLIRYLPWRPSVYALITVIFAVDFISTGHHEPLTLTILRFTHGLAAGCLIGFAAMIITRAGQAERTFAIAVATQLLLGGTITALLAPLIDSVGITPIWYVLMGVSALTLCLVPLLSDYPPVTESTQHNPQPTPRGKRHPAVLCALAGLFLYQVGQLAAYAYVFEMGQAYGFGGAFIGWTVALSLWVGVPSALFVAYWSTRSGRLLPSAGGALLTAFACAMLLFQFPASYVVGNLLFGIFFSITVPYQLANISELDPTGQLASVGALVNSIGPATGPVIAALLIGQGNFALVLGTGISLIVCGAAFTAYTAGYLDKSRRI